MKTLFLYLKKNVSVLVIAFFCLTVAEVHLNLVKYTTKTVITWDVIGYYGYLPAAFIDKDVKLAFITPQNRQENEGIKYAYLDDAAGNHVFKYPMGMSVLYAPFFFAAHLLAEPLGYSADGYSPIYHFFIEFSGLFYLLCGLIFLRRLLLKYYPERITAISLLVICFGTNLLYYSTVEAAMSHAYSFSLFAALLYYVARYYQHPKLSYIMILGILTGLLILVRPPNALFGLAIVLFGVCNVSELKQRFSFIFKQYKHALVLLAVIALVMFPQFLYWHYVTGHWLVFSYGKERFFFNEPQLLNFLLGFRKGWLIYSPVFLFAFAGLWIMRKQRTRDFSLTLFVLLPVYIYVLASWWCWWYGGSFGQRPMVDLYALLAFPLAARIFRIGNLAKTPRIMISGLLVFFIALNIYQTFQYKYNIIHYEAMTFKSYVNAFGKMDRSKVDTSLLDHPDYEKAVRGLGD